MGSNGLGCTGDDELPTMAGRRVGGEEGGEKISHGVWEGEEVCVCVDGRVSPPGVAAAENNEEGRER